jgi:hypothetical protein
MNTRHRSRGNSLFEAASHDHLAGAWLSALRMIRAAVALHTRFAADPWDLDRR